MVAATGQWCQSVVHLSVHLSPLPPSHSEHWWHFWSNQDLPEWFSPNSSWKQCTAPSVVSSCVVARCLSSPAATSVSNVSTGGPSDLLDLDVRLPCRCRRLHTDVVLSIQVQPLGIKWHVDNCCQRLSWQSSIVHEDWRPRQSALQLSLTPERHSMDEQAGLLTGTGDGSAISGLRGSAFCDATLKTASVWCPYK